MIVTLLFILSSIVGFTYGQGVIAESYEQPPYEVIKKYSSSFEIRTYAAVKWVGVSTIDSLANKQNYETGLFFKLLDYISGKNVDGTKMPMTSPVVYELESIEASVPITVTSTSKITMKFYIPRNYQSIASEPKDQLVSLYKEPARTVAVLKFGDYASINEILDNRRLLISALDFYNLTQDYDTVNYIFASYNPPYQTKNRTNEIWFVKK